MNGFTHNLPWSECGADRLLSDKPLCRPRVPRPFPSTEELMQIAKDNPPPPEWYEGEEECPFRTESNE